MESSIFKCKMEINHGISIVVMWATERFNRLKKKFLENWISKL